MGSELFPLEWDSLIRPPGLCPRLGFPAKKEMQTNSRDKKQEEQETYSTPALPCIDANRDHEQHTVFDNAKPARLRMQGNIFFFPIEIFEGHIHLLKI